MPPYLLVRHLLRFRTVEECLAELERLPVASSRALTLCTANRTVTVELTPTARRVIEGGRLLHSNHFLHPDLLAEDRMNIFSRNGSMRRLRRLERLLDEAGPAPAPEACFTILSDHAGICVHGEGDVRREETVGAVVMRPLAGEMHVRRGNPCRSHSQRFAF